MANRRIKDLTSTSTLAATDRIAVDNAVDGTRSIDKDDLLSQLFDVVLADDGPVSYPVTTFLTGGDTPVDNVTMFSIYHTPENLQGQNGASMVVQTIIPDGIGGSGAAGAIIGGFQNNNEGTDAYAVLGLVNNQMATVTNPSGAGVWGIARGNLGGYSGAGFIDLLRGTSEISNAGGNSLLTATVSNASPGVITATAHAYVANQQVMFSDGGSGVLPAALSFNTVYYVKTVLTANTFTVSATKGGAAINTASASTGTVQIHSPQRIRAGLFINNNLYSNPALAGVYVDGAVEYGVRVGSGNNFDYNWEPTYPFGYVRKGAASPVFSVSQAGNVDALGYFIGGTRLAEKSGGFTSLYSPNAAGIFIVADDSNTYINGDFTQFTNRSQSTSYAQISTSGLSLFGGRAVNLAGSTSGALAISGPAIAGTSSIKFPAGTTDFTATGGAGQFVKQNSAGGALTVSAVAVGEISGLGTGVATFLGTPSSANLASAVTGETGSGALVFGTSPTLATPVINGLPTGTGVASANTASTLVSRDASGHINITTLNIPAHNGTGIDLANGTTISRNNTVDGRMVFTAQNGFFDFQGAVQTASTTVGSLPAAASKTGARYHVTDATATTFASIVAGGGANSVPVYSDGTNWRIG